MNDAARLLPLLIGVCLTSGCANTPNEESARNPSLHISGLVVDSAGMPLHFVWVVATLPSDPPHLNQFSSRTDNEGRFTIEPNYTAPGFVPVMELVLKTEYCDGLRDTVTVMALDTLTRSGPDTVDITIPLGSTSGVPIGVGRSCAWVARGILFEESWLDLEIQSVTDSIRGVWDMYYKATSHVGPGTFAGSQEGDSLFLNLSEPRCASDYQLKAEVLNIGPQLDHIGPARIESDSTCWALFSGGFQLVTEVLPR
jgi:hypothetical protein